MRQGGRFARTLLIKNVPAIPAVMLAICECESRPASHTYVRVGPLRRRTAVNHAACDFDFWGEPKAFSLQALVGLVYVRRFISALRGTGPVLYEFLNLLLHLVIDGRSTICFQQ